MGGCSSSRVHLICHQWPALRRDGMRLERNPGILCAFEFLSRPLLRRCSLQMGFLMFLPNTGDEGSREGETRTFMYSHCEAGSCTSEPSPPHVPSLLQLALHQMPIEAAVKAQHPICVRVGARGVRRIPFVHILEIHV